MNPRSDSGVEVVLIGADRVVHRCNRTMLMNQSHPASSSSSNNISVSIPNDETAISTNVEADEPDQSRISGALASRMWLELSKTTSVFTTALMNMCLYLQ